MQCSCICHVASPDISSGEYSKCSHGATACNENQRACNSPLLYELTYAQSSVDACVTSFCACFQCISVGMLAACWKPICDKTAHGRVDTAAIQGCPSRL